MVERKEEYIVDDQLDGSITIYQVNMVGIILASHGEFAEGIHQSGSMIFGDQANVKPCILKPSEGPQDIRKKMEDAIAQCH